MSVFAEELFSAISKGDGDVTVTARDGTVLHANSFILQTCSPVLRAELTGCMQESLTKCITLDCDGPEAQAFIYFLYVGELHPDSFSGLNFLGNQAHLADYYGVIEQFVILLSKETNRERYIAAVDSECPDQDPVVVMKILEQLQPAIAIEKRLATEILERATIRFGSNVYCYLCRCQKNGVAIREATNEACKRVCSKTQMTCTEALSALNNEVNDDSVSKVIKANLEKPSQAMQGLVQFMQVCGLLTIRSPMMDQVVQQRRNPGKGYASIVKVDTDGSPLMLEFRSGQEEWEKLDNVHILWSNSLFTEFANLAALVQAQVAATTGAEDHA